MIAVLVVWIGIGRSQTLSVTRFETLAECEAAKAAIAENYNGFGDYINPENMRCIESGRAALKEMGE